MLGRPNKARNGAPLALGIAIGAAVGVATDDLAIWLGVGVALGAAGTAFLSRRR